MKSILLIGGSGVLSSAVVTEALCKSMDVTIVTRGYHKIPIGVKSIVCDKEDHDRLSQLLDSHYDAVIDFLCYHEDELIRSFTFFSIYTSQYFFISSCAVYDSRVGHCDENSPKVLPMWWYSVEKWSAEQKLVEISSKTNCNYTIIRPAVTYGDTRIPYGIYPQYGYHWTLCARILAGKPIITWNKGENRCNMMRVEDFAVGVVGLIGNEKAYNEAFNICGDETPSWNDVLSVVEEYLHKKAIRVDVSSEFYAEQLPNRAGEILCGRSIDGSCSNLKIKKVVPEFKQTISIKDGIFRTLDAYTEQNYQRGIDWIFDAETDRIIECWCKREDISKKDMNLRFVDYIGNASVENKIVYSKIRHKDSKFRLLMWKIFHRLYKFYKKFKYETVKH